MGQSTLQTRRILRLGMVFIFACFWCFLFLYESDRYFNPYTTFLIQNDSTMVQEVPKDNSDVIATEVKGQSKALFERRSQSSTLQQSSTVELSSTNNSTTSTTTSTLMNSTTKVPFVTASKRSEFFYCLNSSESMEAHSFHLQPLNCSANTDIIWLIKSSIVRNSLRTFIRKSWAKDSFLVQNGTEKIPIMKRVFLVGKGEGQRIHPLLTEESIQFRDILQGNFTDTFRSVTTKVVLGMKFVKEHCSSVKYVIVADDDAIVLPWNIFPLLKSEDNEHFYGGFFVNGSPVRDPNNRWFVPVQDYACPQYPNYALGTMFVMSYKTTVMFYEEALSYRYISMDDVFFGGLAKTLQIKATEISFSQYGDCGSFMQSHKAASFEQLIVCHGADYRKDQEVLWGEFCHTTATNQLTAGQILFFCKESLNMLM